MPKLWRSDYQKETDEIKDCLSMAMVARHMNQKKLAEKMNVTQATISKRLNDVDKIQLGDLRRMCRLLGVSIKIEGERK